MFRSTFLAALALAAPSLALIYGVDSSSLVPEGTFSTAKGEGFVKAVIRGYEEACGSGGEVDPNFLGSYKNARAAGITEIDAYWFPCNGSGNNCKSYATQIAALKSYISSNGMSIGRVWLDIEQDSICNPWNYGDSGNLSQAKSLVAAAKASGLAIGIYSSPGEWSNIFGSYGVVVDNSVPLWFADYNGDESLSLPTQFGGWTSAIGHQYTDVSASGYFDLNVFSS